MKVLSKIIRILPVVIALVAIIIAVVIEIDIASQGMDSIGPVKALGDGETLTVMYEGDDILIRKIDEYGSVLDSINMSRIQDDKFVTVVDMAMDENEYLFLLLNYGDKLTGEYESQSVKVYDLGSWFFKDVTERVLVDDSQTRYRWIQSSNTNLILMGVVPEGDKITRVAFDTATIINDVDLYSLSLREYEISPDEGVYQALIVGLDIAYLSQSGKVYYASADGGEAAEIYPARELTQRMYPMFIAPYDSGVMVAQRGDASWSYNGDFIAIPAGGGAETLVRSGSDPFSGQSGYSPKDVLLMSMRDQGSYVGVVQNETSGYYELLIGKGGEAFVVDSIGNDFFSVLMDCILRSLLYLVIAFGVLGALMLCVYLVEQGRTIIMKLLVASVPLLVAAVVIFGFFAYDSYKTSVEDSFRKQVEDEGNMLTALFGTESYSEIEYPSDYTGEAYQYLKANLNTRDMYTRTAYFDNMVMYIGVDSILPCYYPFEMAANTASDALYERAAYTGQPQIGIVDDAFGERITAITPIGGSSGSTVYLLETGVLTTNMDSYMTSYIINYVITAVLFSIAVFLILFGAFYRVLLPLGTIKEGIEEFSKGNRSIRLPAETGDELSDISRVFNKMVGDIDVQLYNLKSLSETYFKFIPQQTLSLLGKNNLADVVSGTGITGNYPVLSIGMYFKNSQLPIEYVRKTTDSFFNIVSGICSERNVTPMADKMNLTSLKVVSTGGVAEAVEIALASLAALDSMTTTLPVQNRPEFTFVLHKAQLYYGICGDNNRYVSALISDELDRLTLKEELFRQMSSRLIVTSTAYDDLDPDRYFNRYIGLLDDEHLHLYDFYDSYSPAVTRLINNTKGTFDKAMELYGQKRYYEAKNLFVMVLRENQFDNVSRYYLFECEQQLV